MGFNSAFKGLKRNVPDSKKYDGVLYYQSCVMMSLLQSVMQIPIGNGCDCSAVAECLLLKL